MKGRTVYPWSDVWSLSLECFSACWQTFTLRIHKLVAKIKKHLAIFQKSWALPFQGRGISEHRRSALCQAWAGVAFLSVCGKPFLFTHMPAVEIDLAHRQAFCWKKMNSCFCLVWWEWRAIFSTSQWYFGRYIASTNVYIYISKAALGTLSCRTPFINFNESHATKMSCTPLNMWGWDRWL